MRLEVLSKVTLFSKLEKEELVCIQSKLSGFELQEGQVLFRQGNPGNSLYIIEEGSILIEQDLSKNSGGTLHELSSGDYFGELSLLDGCERSVLAIAKSRVSIWEFTRSDLEELLVQYSGMAFNLFRVLSSRLRSISINRLDDMDIARKESEWVGLNEEVIWPDLPLLNSFKKFAGSLPSNIMGIVGLQHLMGTTASLFKEFTSKELGFQNLYFLGKPYSANEKVVDALNDAGCYVHPDSLYQKYDKPHDEGLHENIRTLLQKCTSDLLPSCASSGKKILLIDDGGHAIQMIHEPEFSELLPYIVAVEQTRSGIRRIENLNLKIPIINVAESWVKLEYESPIIAESVKLELFKELLAIESGGIKIGRNVLVIGYGSIGRCVAARLRGCGFQVLILETSQSLIQLAYQDGFYTCKDLHSGLRSSELIIGCTGRPIMNMEDYEHINKDSILISTSSSDVEFRSWNLRIHGVSLGIPKLWNIVYDAENLNEDEVIWDGEDHPCFNLYRVKFKNRNFYLVKGGFPVNFNGQIDPIPPHLIQLTRTLLFAGALQASQSFSTGLLNLREDYQRIIANLFSNVIDD
ncbi:MAG: cyclic nucleotide-binding domain-containing protein [Saprospiraceae bacterium]|nr:cyclic nucleotide-binding domain-containing protein [Saprospiraceae bacterium]